MSGGDGNNLRVMLAVRADLDVWPGGDTVQIHRTAEALRQLGVDAVLGSDARCDLGGFDLVHLWHLERVHETYAHLLNARRQGKRVVLSPIYWPRDGRPLRLARSGSRRWGEELKNLWRLARATCPAERQGVAAALKTGWAACRRDILAGAAVVLPNSQAEADLLAQEAPLPLRQVVAPNAVDVAACAAALAGPQPPRQGVLCVGHFDPRKNQLQLVQALRDVDVPVTFAGSARRMHRRYYERCRRQAGPNMRFLGRLDQPAVLELMRCSKVLACPSTLETPGLANLEAAVMGCHIVVRDCPPIREYFADQATYFELPDPAHLRRAVLAALDSPPPPALAQRVIEQYNWPAAARATLHAYRLALE